MLTLLAIYNIEKMLIAVFLEDDFSMDLFIPLSLLEFEKQKVPTTLCVWRRRAKRLSELVEEEGKHENYNAGPHDVYRQ